MQSFTLFVTLSKNETFSYHFDDCKSSLYTTILIYMYQEGDREGGES